MQVRTGRFRWSSGRRRIVKINPLLPHVRHPLILWPLFGQCALDDAVARHPPVALTPEHSEFDLLARNAQSPQMALACARPGRMTLEVSPDKNANCNCTTSAFTPQAEPWVSVCCATLPGPLALYAVPVRRLTVFHSCFLSTVGHPSAVAFG